MLFSSLLLDIIMFLQIAVVCVDDIKSSSVFSINSSSVLLSLSNNCDWCVCAGGGGVFPHTDQCNIAVIIKVPWRPGNESVRQINLFPLIQVNKIIHKLYIYTEKQLSFHSIFIFFLLFSLFKTLYLFFVSSTLCILAPFTSPSLFICLLPLQPLSQNKIK